MHVRLCFLCFPPYFCASPVLVCSGVDVLGTLALYFWAGACILIGLRLVLIDRFERKKITWQMNQITPELVCVLFVCVHAVFA